MSRTGKLRAKFGRRWRITRPPGFPIRMREIPLSSWMCVTFHGMRSDLASPNIEVKRATVVVDGVTRTLTDWRDWFGEPSHAVGDGADEVWAE